MSRKRKHRGVRTTKTGAQPQSNRHGLQGEKLSPRNPRGMSAVEPANIMATGSGARSKRKGRKLR